MLKKLLILTGVVFFLSCGGESSKEAKELLQKILTIIGIPPSVITNICQTSNSSDMCEGLKLHKLENSKTKTWQKIKETGVGQYLLETNNPCEPILLELTDDDVDYDSGEFFLKFSGVEFGKTSKELSILEAMIDASYLSASSVSSIKTLNSSDAQNKFYATLYGDLKKNINTLRTAGLTKTQSIRGTLKEMAEELKEYGVDSTLPTKINACNDDMACVEGELTELSSKLLIYASETDAIVEAQKDNNVPLNVKEVSCEKTYSGLASGHVTFKDEEKQIKTIPSDAYIRITPSQYQEHGNWNGLRCKIQFDGSFGNQCYIDRDENGMRNAFSSNETKYQILIFKNHIKPDNKRWESGEDLYKYIGNELSAENWSNIEVLPNDYQDRSGE